jgi:hypothetical protein
LAADARRLAAREQVAAMRAAFPQFRVLFESTWHVVWIGDLRPLRRTYRIRVAWTRPRKTKDFEVSTWSPKVWLIDPALELTSARTPGERVPHIYYNPFNPAGSALCLFDPATDEWNASMAVAATTIPWTINWLATYEGWQATGEWTGGGRHPC